MNLATKKNPPLVFAQGLHQWWRLRRTHAYDLRDALLNVGTLLRPASITLRLHEIALAREARIENIREGVHRIDVTRSALSFFWRGPVDGSLYAVIAQEYDVRNPHHYTTAPICLTPDSTVLDVGACEGLFAFRLLKQGEVKRVICFEPSAMTAQLLEDGAAYNIVSDSLQVEVCAVSASSGTVHISEGTTPDACRISDAPDAESTTLASVSLDDYVTANNIILNARDLIKIDAEGADLEILHGAEALIRDTGVQVAVTTYHDETHASRIYDVLHRLRPDYVIRMKGLTLFGAPRFWGGPRPRPVLLQASLPS